MNRREKKAGNLKVIECSKVASRAEESNSLICVREVNMSACSPATTVVIAGAALAGRNPGRNSGRVICAVHGGQKEGGRRRQGEGKGQ